MMLSLFQNFHDWVRKLFVIMRILEYCMKIGVKVYTVKEGYELGDNIQSKVIIYRFVENSKENLQGIKSFTLMEKNC